MPNILDAQGLQTATRQELIDYFTAQFVQIYGSDINLASDTPDGQMINITVQAILDVQDLLVQVYNSFDPDNAVGVVLDQRVALNGIERRAGTYTETPIRITTDREVTLYGLDQTAQPVFTVSDNAGTQWLLKETQLGLSAGVQQLLFRAAEPGAQLTVVNTITNAETIVLGVTEIKNTNSYNTLGENEETDAMLRARRRQSIAVTSQGYLEGLKAALENLPNINSAQVYENEEDFTDGDGIPAHSIWVIIDNGGASAESIAKVIYGKRNAGAGMKGDQTYEVQRPNNSSILVRWDYVEAQNVFIFLTLGSLDGVTPPNVGAVRAQIPLLYHPSTENTLNVTKLGTIVQSVDPNAYVISAGFSTGLVQDIILDQVPTSGYIMVGWINDPTADAIPSTAPLYWNDSTATIQTKIRALPGLETATVTGSMASKKLSVTLTSSAQYDIRRLFMVVAEEAFAGATRIDVLIQLTPLSFVTPNSKKKQFVLDERNVIINPLQLNPSSSVLGKNKTIILSPAGGYGEYNYTMLQDQSGAYIDFTGTYISGSTAGTDIIKVIDEFGNTATAVVTVT